MRWPGPRFTVRRAMLAVLAIAILFGATLPAIEVLRAPDMHVHAWVNPNGSRAFLPPGLPLDQGHMPVTLSQVELRPSPFWPRYWRCLLGRPWRGRPVCDTDPTRLAEACEYAHPGMVRRRDDVSFDIQWPPQILVEMRKRDPSMTMPNPSPPPSPEAP